MQKIPLDSAVEGMVLAREVCRNDKSSTVPVCGKNIVLTSELIKRLDLMDIRYIYVQGQPIVHDEDPSLEKLLEELDHRFERVKNDPLTMKVHGIYADYLKRSMGDL